MSFYSIRCQSFVFFVSFFSFGCSKFATFVFAMTKGECPKRRQVYTFIKKNHPTHVFVIGTTLQFAYLDDFIGKSKMKGACVLHVNPDEPDYMGKKEFWTHDINELDRMID